MPPPITVRFEAGRSGPWHIDRISGVLGDGLPTADRLAIFEGRKAVDSDVVWSLEGTTSNARYTNRTELTALGSVQQGLSRPNATRAALIPIRKSDDWWTLAQDERRAIIEEQSRHIQIGLEYLPPVARRLHHCRELGEPFDFITWFEYAPEHADAFETLVQRLRATEEWRYVEREVDIRLSRF